jgi:diguanylate cyclase (GGDEF)-like protein
METKMSECDNVAERDRLAALHGYDILDSPPEEQFDRITRLAKTVLQMPFVLVSLVDRDRQWFKSNHGMAVSQTPRADSFCTYTIQQNDPLIVSDALLDERFSKLPMVTGEPHIRYYIGVPLRTKDGHNIGALCAMDSKVRRLSREQVDILQDLARLVMDELELRQLATTDSLTGAMSRGAFYEAANRDVMRRRRTKGELSCLVLDVDFFKSVNDSYGHAVGDLVLQKIVAVLKAGLRASDYVGRIGGEEFAIMLPECTLAEAFELAERLRTALQDTVLWVAQQEISVTASVGIATSMRSEHSVSDLLQRADEALYAAKLGGRNRTICFGVTGTDLAQFSAAS